MRDREMLEVALEEARSGLSEGGIPIGAALFTADGKLLGRGLNRRIQGQDPSLHGETDAFRRSGRRRSYRDTVMVTTLAPCWYCSGLMRQFGIPKVVVGESVNFSGGIEWLRQCGVEVVDLASKECVQLSVLVRLAPSSLSALSGQMRHSVLNGAPSASASLR
jgi:cytosine/creatinine deaminase